MLHVFLKDKTFLVPLADYYLHCAISCLHSPGVGRNVSPGQRGAGGGHSSGVDLVLQGLVSCLQTRGGNCKSLDKIFIQFPATSKFPYNIFGLKKLKILILKIFKFMEKIYIFISPLSNSFDNNETNNVLCLLIIN